MSGSVPRVVEGSPHMFPLMLKAALPLLPGANLVAGLIPGVGRHGGDLPDLALTRHDVPVDPAHVAAYAALCGFPRQDTLPVSYPHLLAFPLHLAIMTDSSFPFPAIGTVHLENSITAHRPIAIGERLQVTARPANLRAHAKGTACDLLTTIHSGGEPVWEETSTFLRRGKGDGSRPAEEGGLALPAAPRGTTEWRLPGDLGRRYAAVSGDHNPIHLYALTAKAFGFPRQIAHGMWSLARCLGAVENRLPGAVRVGAAFKTPLLLPGRVSFGLTTTDDGLTFGLTNPEDGAPHVVGSAVPA